MQTLGQFNAIFKKQKNIDRPSDISDNNYFGLYLTVGVHLDLFIYLSNHFSIKTWLVFIYFLILSSINYMLLHGFHLDSLTKYRG